METTSSNHTSASEPALVPLPSRRSYEGLAISAIVAGTSLAWHFQSHSSGALVPATTEVGRWYGLAGALLFSVSALAQAWGPAEFRFTGSSARGYQVHLVLGTLLLALVGFYQGFQVRPDFLILLQAGFWATVFTGAGAWAGQFTLHRWLIRNEWRPLAWNELETERAQSLQLLAATGAGDLARERAVQEARRGLEQLRTGLLWQFPSALTWDGEATHLLGEPGIKELSAADRKLLLEWHRLEVQRAYQDLLRGWTHLHMSCTMAGVQLMLWHTGLAAAFPC